MKKESFTKLSFWSILYFSFFTTCHICKLLNLYYLGSVFNILRNIGTVGILFLKDLFKNAYSSFSYGIVGKCESMSGTA